MSKAKKQKTKAPAIEGKYEAMCHEYMERDELEALNRKVDERNAWVEGMIWEQEKKAEHRRWEQQRRFNAISNVLVTTIVAIAIVALLAALVYLEVFGWQLSMVGWLATSLIAAFRVGYFWHEVKN